MRTCWYIFLILLGFELSAQEAVAPLRGNMKLIGRSEETSKNISAKTNALNDTITLPFFEDFYYADRSPFPSSKYWTDSSVYVNTGFAIAPPSQGVATFDGLNKLGYPYNITATDLSSAAADYLTSKPVNLYSDGSAIYTPGDSIAFSFLYQSAGFGENPEVNDSLILEFYQPLYVSPTNTVSTGRWKFAWGTRGVSNPKPLDSTFKKAFVFITDTAYFHEGFKFRFRNKATGSGSLDHWNVDYIYLDRLRKQSTDSTYAVYNDVAFSYVPRPLLKSYSAMPYEQYNAGEMGHHFSNFMRYNGLSASVSNNYKFEIYDPSNTLAFQAFKGFKNIKPFLQYGYQNDTVHSNPYVDYSFPTLTSPATYMIKHIRRQDTIGTAKDNCPLNDTIYEYQVFDNYYAYDDGSAERAYYLNNAPGGKIAQRYTLNVTDTLRALDIFFDPVIEGNLIQNSTFRIVIWGYSLGSPGTILLRDSAIYPKYLQYGYNKPPRYFLTSPKVLTPGTYFFGIQQTGSQHLNIGLDLNIDHKSALFFDTQGYWEQSAINGSLMIHPIFGSAVGAVGVNEVAKEKTSLFSLYPNPSNSFVMIRLNSEETQGQVLEFYSSIGQKVFEKTIDSSLTRVDTHGLNDGIYFVMLKKHNTVIGQQKLIITR